MNVDTDTQYAFTRPVAGYMFTNYDGVLKVDGEVGNKKAYDPRAWGKAAEAGMAARVVEACQNLRSRRHPRVSDNLLGIPETRLPVDPAAAKLERRASPPTRWPRHTRPRRWPGRRWPRTRSPTAAPSRATPTPAPATTAALDSLRKNGWRGQGRCRGSTSRTAGFLRALAALARAAGAIGETDEERAVRRSSCATRARDRGARARPLSPGLVRPGPGARRPCAGPKDRQSGRARTRPCASPGARTPDSGSDPPATRPLPCEPRPRVPTPSCRPLPPDEQRRPAIVHYPPPMRRWHYAAKGQMIADLSTWEEAVTSGNDRLTRSSGSSPTRIDRPAWAHPRRAGEEQIEARRAGSAEVRDALTS